MPVQKTRRAIEELRATVRAMVVVHRHLDDAEAGILELAHHLEADDAVSRSSVTRSKTSRRISRKSQSTSRTRRRKSSFTV
jgi:hypothetical protein